MSAWYGIHVSESVELAIVFALFMCVLIGVYYLQRWIGDY